MAHAQRLTDRWAWRVVAGTYLAVYGGIIWLARGLPYAVDNNESFSSLWHARNLHDVSWRVTKGLADEVAAWHPAASPFVHTHQGDFPRLFAFVLYVLGARSIESQIIITTFTVGLLALWFAYRFLRTIGPPAFAAIVCLGMLTNYPLFGQWQVNTYRVWYGFFFFSSLLWVSSLAQRPSWKMLLIGVINFAALFYGEYVFAAFIGLTIGFYALGLYYRQWLQIFRAGLTVTAGGALAAGILLTQLTAYMGWENVRRDIHYTLSARNMAFDAKFAAEANSFFFAHHIIFLQNYVDATSLRSVASLFATLFQQHLVFYDPWLLFSGLVVGGGCLLGFGFPRPAPDPADGLPRFHLTWPLLLSALLVLAAVIFAAESNSHWFDPVFARQWQLFSGFPAAEWVGKLIFALGAFFALAMTLAGGGPRLNGFVRLSLSVFFGYIIIYRIFTGYIYSGYLVRQAPFLVFWTDILLGSAVYFIFDFVIRFWQKFRLLPALGGCLLLALVASRWLSLQSFYWHLIPSTNYSFLRLLSEPPFRGGTFAVNTYSAPVADKTRAWAYADSTVFSGQLKLGTDGFSVPHDIQYLWFADAATNPAYLKPAFGLLIAQPSNIGMALSRSSEAKPAENRFAAFDGSGVVERSLEPMQAFLQYRFMASDGSNYTIVRFDWDFPPYLRPANRALYDEIAAMPLPQRVTLSEAAEQMHRHWRIEIESLPRNPSDGPSPLNRLIADASIDGRPIFSGQETSGTGPIVRVAIGDELRLHLREGPDGGRVRLIVNDRGEVYDLRQGVTHERTLSLSVNRPYGRHTMVPNFSPGIYVKTSLMEDRDGPKATVEYRYAQQEGKPEEQTTIRIYNQEPSGSVQLVDAIAFLGPRGFPVRLEEFRRLNPDTVAEQARVAALGDSRTFAEWLADHLSSNPTELRRPGIVNEAQRIEAAPSPSLLGDGPTIRRVPLPVGLTGWLQISVTPGTRTKPGAEYFSLPFAAHRPKSAEKDLSTIVKLAPPAAHIGDLPYGHILLRVRFPRDKTGQAEPIISTGIEEAGDFIYVIYIDRQHIRLGFDHWYKGGPLSAPISIDYARDHQMELVMGSLVPHSEDIVFAGVPAAKVARLKRTIRVTLDGNVVLDGLTDFYESAPREITLGKNTIAGTTSNPLFTGKILSSRHTWPELDGSPTPAGL